MIWQILCRQTNKICYMYWTIGIITSQLEIENNLSRSLVLTLMVTSWHRARRHVLAARRLSHALPHPTHTTYTKIAVPTQNYLELGRQCCYQAGEPGWWCTPAARWGRSTGRECEGEVVAPFDAQKVKRLNPRTEAVVSMVACITTALVDITRAL